MGRGRGSVMNLGGEKLGRRGKGGDAGFSPLTDLEGWWAPAEPNGAAGVCCSGACTYRIMEDLAGRGDVMICGGGIGVLAEPNIHPS